MILNKYILGNSIGRGSFGSVYYCIQASTHKEFAVKVLSKSALQKQTLFNAATDDSDSDAPMETQLTQLYKEIAFMRSHPHPLLLPLHEVIDQSNSDKLYIVMGLAEGVVNAVHEDAIRCPISASQLNTYPQLHLLSTLVTQPTPPLHLFSQMHQVALGLAFMHNSGYVHGDLKQANILRTADGRLVLADFGLTQLEVNGKKYKQAVSPAFSAPESNGLTFQNDVWAYGVIFFMNLVGFHPAALVNLYCHDQNIQYKEPHWGIFIQKNFKDVKAYFLRQADNLTASWKNQFQMIQKTYQNKLEADSIPIMIDIAAQVCFQCFAPVEKRPSMQQITQKLSELNCKYHATKIQKHLQTNTKLQAGLIDFIRRLNMADYYQLQFVLRLHLFKQFKEEYSAVFDFQTLPDPKDVAFEIFTNSQPIESATPTKEFQAPVMSTSKLEAEEETTKSSSDIILKSIPASKTVMQQEVTQLSPQVSKPPQQPVVSPPISDPLPVRSREGRRVLGPMQIQQRIQAPGSIEHMVKQLGQNPTQEEISQVVRRASAGQVFQLSAGEQSSPPTQMKLQTNLRMSQGGISKAGSIAAKIPVSQVESDSDDNPQLGQNQRSSVARNGIKLPSGPSAASKMPPPPLSTQDVLAEMKPQGGMTATQSIVRSPIAATDADDCAEKKQDGRSAKIGFGRQPQNSVEHMEDSSSSGDMCTGTRPLTGQRQFITQPPPQPSNPFKKDSAPSVKQPASSLASTKFPSVKIQQSAASILAAQFAQKTQAQEVPDDDSDGPAMIRCTKPMHSDLPPAPKPKILNFDAVDVVKLQAVAANSKTTPRNLNLLQTELVEHDEMFALSLQEQHLMDSREKLGRQASQTDGVTSYATPAEELTEINLEQRQNFFLRLDVHFETIKMVEAKQIKELFQKISYKRDDIRVIVPKKDVFQYDHSQDQNQIIGLGSFSNVETLSAGRRDSDDDDFSDDDDELIEIDNDPDSVQQQMNEIMDLDDDAPVGSGNLILQGQGRFAPLDEMKQDQSSSKFSEEDTTDIAAMPAFLSARVVNSGNGASLLPFVVQNQRVERTEKPSISHTDRLTLQQNVSLPIEDSSLTCHRIDLGMSIEQSQSQNFQLKKSENPNEESSSSDLGLSASQTSVQPTSGSGLPFLSLANVNFQQKNDDKLHLFDQDSDEENLKTDQRLTARLTARTAFKNQKKGFQEPVQGPVSARQDTRHERPDKIELTDKQLVIFLHGIITLFNMSSYQLEGEKPAILDSQEYMRIKDAVISPIRSVQQNQLLMMPLSMDDLLLNVIVWRDYVAKHRFTCPAMKQLDIDIKRVESLLDNSPAFLRPQCGWVLVNQFSFYKDFSDIIFGVNGSPGNLTGMQLSINNQLLIACKSKPFHDVQVYIGLEKAECTPIVGIRHKSLVRTLCCQLSDRNIPFQEDETGLNNSLTMCTPIHMSNESLTIPQNKFFRFKFTQQRVQYDFNQYRAASSTLYQLVFISLNKQCMMPFVLFDSLIDLVMNARKNSRVGSTIRVAIFNSEDNFYMIVSDAGTGILEEQTDPCFKEVAIGLRTAEGNVRQFGNGSGIAKLKLLVGFYGGVVNISSIENGGTKIIVKLPIAGEVDKYSARVV